MQDINKNNIDPEVMERLNSQIKEVKDNFVDAAGGTERLNKELEKLSTKQQVAESLKEEIKILSEELSLSLSFDLVVCVKNLK